MRQATEVRHQLDTTALIAVALPMPLLVVGSEQEVLFVNPAAEQFFDTGAGFLLKQRLDKLIPFGSPLIGLIAQARERGASAGERTMDLTTPRHGKRVADVTVTPLSEPEGAVVITLQERSLAQRIDRQLLHRDAVRSLQRRDIDACFLAGVEVDDGEAVARLVRPIVGDICEAAVA